MQFDAVVIGRNEGARLLACLRAVRPLARQVVYVDSGSTDGSVAAARALGVQVVALDRARPFTAARARNSGLAELDGDVPVQMLDGDCVIDAGWPAHALAHLQQHPRAGLVFGRQVEAAPDASLFNLLIDWEWDKPHGPASSCAGCLMARPAALEAVGGYDAALIAGEDDDICLRLQRAGWQTWCIDAPMTEHDARLVSIRPWWRRCLRAGHSYAELGALHGAARAQRLRALGWGGVLPALALVGLVAWWPLTLAVAAAYALSIARQAGRFRARGLDGGRAVRAAGFVMLGKLAELAGMAGYWLARLRRRRRGLIEYR